MHDSVEEPDSVKQWLARCGMERYATLFETSEIGFDVLPQINSSDLKELNIPLGDRLRILVAIDQLRNGGEPEEASPPEADTAPERRQITVLFCDLVGSTAMSNRMDPEDLSDAIRKYQKACDALVQQWGGFIAQYLGDGILAYFGWPVAHENDAQRAVLAGFAMAESTGKMTASDGTALAARVGIATGLVMVGETIGKGTAQQEIAVGATPNVAARIQSLARPGTVVIADSTRKLVGDAFALTDLGQKSVAGVEQPVRLWCVDDTHSGADWLEAGEGRRMAPLVGRQAESRRIGSLWQSTKSGKGGAIQIVGQAGVGKTRLVQAFYDGISGSSHRLIRLQGSSFHQNTPLFPAVEEIGRMLGMPRKETGSADATAIAALVESAGMEREPATSFVASLLELPVDEHPSVQGLSRKLRRQRTIETVVNLLTRSAAAEPLLIMVEDVHWIDPSTLLVLDDIIARAKDDAILVLLTVRPETDLTRWAGLEGIDRMDLDALSDEHARQLILQATDGLALPEDAIATIVSNTDGVPLFVKELTKSVLESGQLTKTDSSYELKETVLQLDIPSTLQASFSARLDQRPSAKPVAQAAATIGRSFVADLLGFVTGIAPDVLHRHLASLCELGVLVQDDGDAGRYQFTHALLQETAYLSQLKARRRAVHGQIAGALRGPFSRSSENRPIILAHHLAESGDAALAADQYLSAGRVAISASAVEEAIAHLNKGLDLLGSLDASQQRDLLEMRLQASVGTALMLSDGWAAPDVQNAYTRASQLSGAAQDPKEQLWILWGAWVSRNASGRIEQGAAIHEQIRIVADESQTNDSLLIGDMVSLQVAFYSGRFGDAIRYCESMRGRFSADRHRALVNLYSTDLEVVAMVHQSIALWITGEPDEALELVEQAERTARALNHSYSLAWAMIWGATVPILCGAWPKARSLVRESLAIGKTQGYDYVHAFSRVYLGYIDFHEKNDPSGLEEMAAGADGFRSTGAEIVIPHFWTMIASVQCESGAASEALDFLQRAEDRVGRFGEIWQLSEIHRVRAEAMRKLDKFDDDAVAAELRKAVDIATRQGARGWCLRASTGLADHLNSIGRRQEAIDVLTGALSHIEKPSRCADVRNARQLLQRLANVNATDSTAVTD